MSSPEDIFQSIQITVPAQQTIEVQTSGLRGPQGIKGDTGDVGPAFKVDAFDLFANRHLYDASPKNFAFFATDNGNVYIHGTGNAVWSAGIPFQGPQGLKGDTGATGSAGTDGTNGTNGKDGSNGANGTNGVDGKSAYQVAVADGYSGTEAQWLASLVGAKGDKGDTGSQGLKGDTGSTGSQGAQGNPGTPGTPGTAATISVGTVATGAAGSSVTITNSGTTSAAVLNFTIPKGDTGAAGSGGGTYTAGTGLTLNSNVFAADTTILAPLASPALTGTATAVNLTVSGSLVVPTQTAGDNTTKAASTAFVTTAVANGVASKANLSSPTFTGTPAAPTAALGVANTQIATTGFVATSINSILTKSVAGGVNVTLSSAEAAYTTVILTGAITANIAVILPNSKGPTTFRNNTTGAFSVTIKTASGTGIAVTQGQSNELYADGTNVVQCQTDFVSTALTGTPTAPTATAGTSTTQIATTAFVASAVSGVASTPGATGAPGRGIQSLAIDGNGHLQVAYTDSTSADLGVVVGAAGATGQTGAAGTNGAAATVTLGTVTTGAAGSSVAITNSGTTSAAVLNFTIPQGAQGSAGTTGGTGPAGPGVPAGGASGYVLSKNSATDFDTAWIAAPSGGGSYTLETDTAPTLNYPLQLNGKDVKSTISTNGAVQNIKMLPSATTVGASLVLTAQKPDDSASVASITLAAQSGGNYGGVTISHRSNGVTIQNLGNSATYLLPSTAGLSGQLMTSSGPAGSLTWTTPVTPHPGYKVGNYYTSEFASASNTANAFGNNLVAVPIFIPVATNMDQLGVYSGTLSNSTSINLGIYNNSAGYPTSLIASGTVTIASSSTSYTIATGTKALAAGWYWLAAVASGTMTGIPVIVPDGALGPIVGSASMGQFAGNALSIGFTYAALPTTFPANATRSNSGNLMPVTYWRAA